MLMSCAVVVSLFFGIKWRLFGYRMKIPSIEEEPEMLRTRSATEVRENCSTGRYSYLEDNSIPNYMPSTTSSSSSNVKSKNSEFIVLPTLISTLSFYTFFHHYQIAHTS